MVKEYAAEQFLSSMTCMGNSFSHDEKSILFSSNRTGIFDLFSVPAFGGCPRQLARSGARNTYAISYFPNDKRALFRRDADGDEYDHIYVLDTDGRERDLTPYGRVKAKFLGWSYDGKNFYCLINKRDPRFFDLFKIDLETFDWVLLYRDTVGYETVAVSKDEAWLAFIKSGTAADSDIYLYNAADGELIHLTPHTGDIRYGCISFDPRAPYLYFTTDEGSEFLYLKRYGLRTGEIETVEEAPWDIGHVQFSPGGTYRVLSINEDACVKIRVYNNETGSQIALPGLPGGSISSVDISRSERFVTFYLNEDRSPGNLYLYDVCAKRAYELTYGLSPLVDRADLVESESLRYRSFDGLGIPSLLWKPHRASAAARAPALVWVHGGPGGQTRKGYNELIQYLVNHGYVVIGVNNRGSCGYGKTFLAADVRKHGREPLWDCIEARKFLASLGYVDPSRIGIIGESYGGYMVLAALAFRPEEFSAGVDLFGVSDWIRTIESIPAYWESDFRELLYREVGDPVADREMLRAISPLYHADRIVKPLMVLQGANDPRVLRAESDDMVRAVKDNGGIVEYVVFDDEGHGFTKRNNKVRAFESILHFLDLYL